jgi:hypothetical protein
MSSHFAETMAPHFMQIGDTPVFIGTGAGDLVCACGASVLVRGHRPAALLGIAIECAKCGAITTTPGLPDGVAPPANARLASRDKMPVPTSMTLTDDFVLGDREQLEQQDALSRPAPVPAAPMVVSEATLAALAADYDRMTGGRMTGDQMTGGHMTGGRLAADREAMRPDRVDLATSLPPLPLAWAFEQLAPNLDRPGWWCLAQEPDAVAALQLGAFQQFSAVWSRHPMFGAMVASVVAGGFSTHAMAVFAAAQSLAASGNRVRFTEPAPGQTMIDSFHLETGPTEPLPVVVRRFDRFDWPGPPALEQAAVRAAAIDAMIASQSRITPRHPGILVLSVGAVQRQKDPVIITGLAQTLADRWRKHKGLVGVAVILPKIFPTTRSDQVTFGWTFLPDANPRYAGTFVQTREAATTPRH